MYQFLILFILSALTFTFVFFFNKKLSAELSFSTHDLRAKEKDFEALVEESDTLNCEIAALDKDLGSLLAVYDITKELSKSLDSEQVLGIFKDKMIFTLGLAECFISAEAPCAEAGYKSYPITIEEEAVKYLVIKESDRFDESIVSLMLNQLTLALRRGRLYQEIQKLSISDGLTGLYARRYFAERAGQEFSRASHYNLCLSFLMLDIDHFKSYNDTFGHIVGDMLLKKVAGIVCSGLRQIDMCARWGGEEFCVLLPDTDKKGAFMVAERLRVAVEQERIKAYDEDLKVTISIGVAAYPEDAKDYNPLLDKADKALYKAKNSGRNQVFVYGMKKG